MKISHKLILGLGLLISLTWVVGLYATTIGERALRDRIEQDATTRATEIIHEVDGVIHAAVDNWRAAAACPDVQEAIKASNLRFEQMQDVQAYIDRQECEWRAAPKETITPFMESLLANGLSAAMRARINTLEEHSGYPVYGEVFVTNRYGANVAQTGKTSDYRQDDEQWWQRAKADGLYVADVGYDESAGIHSVDICMRIDDENGNFIGVIKAVFNIETVNILLRSRGMDAAPVGEREARGKILLLGADGAVILPREAPSDDIAYARRTLASHDHSHAGAAYVTELHDEQFGRILVCCAVSEGRDEYGGLGWTLLVQYGLDEIMRPVAALRVRVLVISTVVTLGGLVLGFLLSVSLSRRITRLRDAAGEIGRGNLDVVLNDDADDEIGQLGKSFVRMAGRLSETLVSKTALAEANQQLESQVVERERAQKYLKVANLDLTLMTERLQEVNRDLTDFVYVASHDLREPLRKISSFGGLLKESLEGKLEEDDRENLEYMTDGADRMTRMIEGLLAYSRVNTEEVPLEAVDCNEIVEQLEQFELRAILEETGGSIEVPRPLPKVKADPGQITQLFQNLIANGIKYRREGVQPRVAIRAGRIDDGAVRIEVRDNGIGISREYREDIFKMFRRLHSRQKYPGTGIGLALCKKIIGRHGGRIGVESNDDEGSTFWFTLSAARETAVEKAEVVVS